MTSMQLRIKRRPQAKNKTTRRVNPVGLGRLIIMALVFGLLTFAQGLFWWTGFGFLGVILVTLSVRTARRAVPWTAAAAESLLAFSHTGIVPFGWGMLGLSIAFTVYLVLLLAPRHEPPLAVPGARSYRPPTWVGYPPLHKNAELYTRPNAGGKKR